MEFLYAEGVQKNTFLNCSIKFFAEEKPTIFEISKMVLSVVSKSSLAYSIF